MLYADAVFQLFNTILTLKSVDQSTATVFPIPDDTLTRFALRLMQLTSSCGASIQYARLILLIVSRYVQPNQFATRHEQPVNVDVWRRIAASLTVEFVVAALKPLLNMDI